MKKKTGKWIRQVRLTGILFIIGVLTLAIYGSFAAYTSFNSVKRVVSTGTQSDTMFSSNYLSQLNLDDVNYPVKRISLAEKDGTCTFVVQVCNYIWGDSKRYNLNDITYKIIQANITKEQISPKTSSFRGFLYIPINLSDTTKTHEISTVTNK